MTSIRSNSPTNAVVFAAVALGLFSLVAGCNKPPAAKVEQKPPEVIVDKPVVRSVGDYEDFTGRMEAVNEVEIRSQVTGYLEKVHFKDGADVKAGDLLFEIDPSIYQANLKQAIAAVAQANARVERTTKDYQRTVRLFESKNSSQEELDRASADKAEAVASLAAAEAMRTLAETNVGYTQIHAKFAGRLSRRMVDPGNVVKSNETMLTTLVALDPINATFDIDERTTLRIRRLIREGKVDSARTKELHVQIALSDEELFTHTGTIDFIDNRLDPSTGTLRLRATVPNSRLLFSPGLFVRVRVPVGAPHPSFLVPEEALGSDQGQKYVYVVNSKSEVEYRRVVVGRQEAKFRIIESGIKGDEQIVVSGIQRVRPGTKVVAKLAGDLKGQKPDGAGKDEKLAMSDEKDKKTAEASTKASK